MLIPILVTGALSGNAWTKYFGEDAREELEETKVEDYRFRCCTDLNFVQKSRHDNIPLIAFDDLGSGTLLT